MTIAEKQHPADTLAEWVAPAVLAAAAAWAAWMIFRWPLASLVGACVALAIGICAMRILGAPRQPVANSGFEPVSFEECVEDDILLLDDPLGNAEPDSRVVRLFAQDEATPGELVARIADYLGDRKPVGDAHAAGGSATPPDASAALHAALANIRASLR